MISFGRSGKMLGKVKRIVKKIFQQKNQMVVNAVLNGRDQVSGHFVRVLKIEQYPPVILAGYLEILDEIVKKEGAYLRKTVRYAPTNFQFTWSTKAKIKRLQKNIEAETITDPARREEKDALDTILELRDSQTSDKRKLLDFWTFLTISAPKQSILDSVANKLNTWFDNMEGELNDLRREQLEAMRQTSVFSNKYTTSGEFFDKNHYGRVVTDSTAARSYPFTKGSFSDVEGVYFGRRTEDGSFCWINICDPDDPRAQNIVVNGKTGQGKSFFLKALVEGLLEEGVYVFVFDLDGEWRDLCEAVDGVYIDHTADNGKYFEPLTILPPLEEVDQDCIDYNKRRYSAALQNGIRTFSLLADGLQKGELFEVGEAIKRTYQNAGIKKEDSTTWNNPNLDKRPTIHRAFDEIKSASKTSEDALSVYKKIRIYFDGVYNGIFADEEELTFHRAPLIVYKVGQGIADDQNDETAKQAQLKMSMAFDMVNANIQILKYEGIYFTAVLVDEGQRQLKNKELKRAVFNWYTAIRKWNGMMILGSNTPAIMLETAEGQGMWENTSVRVYFYMEQSAIRLLDTHTDVPIEIQERISQNEDTLHYILEYHKTFDELIMDVPKQEAKLYKTRGLRSA